MEDFNRFTIRGRTEDGIREFECTPENTELYLHHPRWQEVDHIFHRIDDADRRLGAFVWRHVLGEELFEQHAQLMTGSMNFIVSYRPTPTESDLEQFSKDVTDIPNELPDDWDIGTD